MSHHHVLLIGGHGKIAQLLTPLLLARSWTVTSLIRSTEQVSTVDKLRFHPDSNTTTSPTTTTKEKYPGKLNIIVSDIEEVDCVEKARDVLNHVKADYVVWSAGAGGKGAPERTFQIDRDAAVHFIHAAASIPTISRFLLISYIGSRRNPAPWWSVSEWTSYDERVNKGVLADYYKAKIVADEELYKTCKQSKTLVGVSLRPGTLTDGPVGGVEMGKMGKPSGDVSRESVANVIDMLLALDKVESSWIDFYGGDEDISKAVKDVVENKIDVAEGEPVYGK